MPKPFVSRDRRIALGELKNLAGLLMGQPATQETFEKVSAIALRMQAVIQGEVDVSVATDLDIENALEAAREVEGQMLEQMKKGARRAHP